MLFQVYALVHLRDHEDGCEPRLAKVRAMFQARGEAAAWATDCEMDPQYVATVLEQQGVLDTHLVVSHDGLGASPARAQRLVDTFPSTTLLPPSTSVAAVMHLGTQAAFFIGNYASTFSINIARARDVEGRKSAVYYSPSSGEECASCLWAELRDWEVESRLQ